MKMLLVAFIAALAACSSQPPVVDQPLPPAVYQYDAQGNVVGRTGYTKEEIARNESRVFCQQNPQIYDWVPCKPSSDDQGNGDDD